MTRYISTPAALHTAISSLSTAAEIALDTEFHHERSYYPDLMLVQLRADDGEALLIDPLAGLDLRPLGEVLSVVPVILHGGAMDVQIVQRALDCRMNVTFDTQIAAGCAGQGYPMRLQTLAQTYLGTSLEKGETLSDWSRRPLTPTQMAYAADDVLVLHGIKQGLTRALADRGTIDPAMECMREQLTINATPTQPGDAWRTIPSSNALSDAERATFRLLVEWRENEARRRNVPRHSLVSDGILTDIARRAPSAVDELRANRRMPTHVWKREGEAVMDCVRRGLASPPVPSAQSAPKGWAELVRGAARAAELRSGFATELTVPERVLNDLHAGRPLAGWRKTVLGESFSAFIAGTSPLMMPDEWRVFTIS